MQQSAIFMYMYTKTKLISDKIYSPFFINFGSSKLKEVNCCLLQKHCRVLYIYSGGVVSLKLIDSLLHWAIWVWALAEDIVLTVSLGKTFYSHKASLNSGV